MNDFDPKHLRSALFYLTQKLNASTKERPPLHAAEEEKVSFVRHLVNLLFKR